MKAAQSAIRLSVCFAVLVAFGPATNGATVADRRESCRKFVQEFYNWYSKRSEKGMGISGAIQARRSTFSPELLRRLREDAAAAAKHPNEIVGLDFDPVLNGQDFAKKYVVGKVTRKGGSYFVEVFGIWDGKKSEIPDVKPELVWINGRWRFENFHYQRDTKKPNEDTLLSVLRQLRDERKRSGGSQPRVKRT